MLKGFEVSAKVCLMFGVFSVLPLAGCGGTSEEAPPGQEVQVVSQPLSEGAQILVDQGNTAQREGRYTEALDFFGQALEMHPNHPVPQFGSLLAATAVGDTTLAKALREKLAVTGPELLGMLGPEGGMGGMTPAPPGAAHMPPGTLPLDQPSIEAVPPDTLRSIEFGKRG